MGLGETTVRRQELGGRRKEAGARRQEFGGRREEAGARRQELDPGESKEVSS